MKLRQLYVVFAAFALFTATCLAASIDGKWTSEMTGPDGQARTSTFNLKSDGSKLTGTIGGPQGDHEISNGKVDGDNVSFEVTFDRNGQSRTMKYSGKLSGDQLNLKVEGGRAPRDIVAKRTTS